MGEGRGNGSGMNGDRCITPEYQTTGTPSPPFLPVPAAHITHWMSARFYQMKVLNIFCTVISLCLQKNVLFHCPFVKSCQVVAVKISLYNFSMYF